MNESNAANESDPARETLDPTLLDRLVDGELAEAERRKLLLSLDHQPSGWRQCALAFLEAQSWGELFGCAAEKGAPAKTQTTVTETAVTQTAAETPTEPAEAVSLAVAGDRARRRSPPRWLWVMEMAASFLVAFSLGLLIRGGSTTTLSTQTGDGVGVRIPRPVDQGGMRTVEVVVEGPGGKVERMQVPIVDNSRLGWWQSQPAAGIPDDVRQAVERSGGQIRQERKYFPVELSDGRRGVVPVDQIEVVPVGNRGMQ